MIKKLKGFSGDYGVKMHPNKLRTLCKLEWPTFNVRWSSKGTLDVPTEFATPEELTGETGHPDQFLYIKSWLGIAQTLAPWV